MCRAPPLRFLRRAPKVARSERWAPRDSWANRPKSRSDLWELRGNDLEIRGGGRGKPVRFRLHTQVERSPLLKRSYRTGTWDQLRLACFSGCSQISYFSHIPQNDPRNQTKRTNKPFSLRVFSWIVLSDGRQSLKVKLSGEVLDFRCGDSYR